MESFLLDATIYLAAAVIAVPIAARLGLGSVLGYLLAGLVIGPITGIASSATADLQHFAEFGVVMMLFLIGLELEPRTLWAMRHRLMGLGGLQILLTTGVIFVAVMALGQGWQTSLAVGMTLALSSTAIVLQTLSEKGLIQTAGGRSTFSVLLTQDIAVIPMLALLPLLAIAPTEAADTLKHSGETATFSLVEGLPGWGVTLVTLGAVAAVIFGGRYLIRPLFRYIDSARLREMYTAFALLIVVGIAVLMDLVGLSPALGTFLAGVILAGSEFRHELETDIQPFKGLLLGLFFITVGAGIDLVGFLADPLRLLALTLLLMAGKAAVLAILGRAFGLRRRDHWLFTLGLAQAGEFGFVLITFALQQGVVTEPIGADLLTIIALSMLLTPLAFIAHDLLSRRRQERTEVPEADEIDEQHRIIIVGSGRFGQVVNRLVRSAGFETTLLDHDLKRVQFMRRLGVKTFLGDTTRIDLLRAAGLATAKILVIAINNPEGAVNIVRQAKRMNPDVLVIVRARDRAHTYELLQAGADHVVRELFDSSLRVGRYVLENVGLSEYEAAQAEKIFYQHDRHTIRELRELWKPGVPTSENQAYLDRAVQLEHDIQSALLTQLMTDDALEREQAARDAEGDT
ncbi:monovalent cation:proton antiporter-2 (CPA2) family protein [Sinisalibacter aestuarii]|uniref:Potassium transporter n=1 Tax=Sinisalibacter aestuarii TaxID=2949426 RepID=A0ABQ5LWF4_9RHOB|nr:monovalent cation:proton antiporter-2 (CPA2) family protein [Sinisalibacter aestuarii]GKY88720.1 potassium transporter [Sinisalibacter aestuarii]